MFRLVGKSESYIVSSDGGPLDKIDDVMSVAADGLLRYLEKCGTRPKMRTDRENGRINWISVATEDEQFMVNFYPTKEGSIRLDYTMTGKYAEEFIPKRI